MTAAAEQFPYVPRDPSLGNASLAPMLPLTLLGVNSVTTSGLVDSGAAINVLAASLTEGLGSPEFQRVMAENPDLKVFKERILGKDCFVMDQWQLEELAKVVERCKVKVVTQGLPPETLRRCYVEPAASVEQAVEECLAEYGPKARIAVIPKGPYVLPYVAC